MNDKKIDYWLNKYHDKIASFRYNYKKEGILSFYCKNLHDKDIIKIQLGDVVAIISQENYIIAYIHPEEFIEILESGEITENER